MPARPPPMINASWLNSSDFLCRGWTKRTLAIAIRNRSLAFSVAASGTSRCTHEH